MRDMEHSWRKRVHENFVSGPLHWVVMAAIIISVTVFTLETMPELQPYAETLQRMDVALAVLFGLEYVVRIVVSPRPLRYLFSFYGLVDFISIAPSLFGFDSKGIRVVRLVRLLKTVQNPRVNAAVSRLYRALKTIRADLFVFGCVALMVMYLASVGIYLCEHDAQPEAFVSIPASFWWAMATLTTVGYGDVYPITVAGKLFASVVVFVGIGIVAIPTGLFATALTAARTRPPGADTSQG